jgi:tetratricopeptide (TPR) repeat protein
VPASAAATSALAPVLDGREQALGWARAERASLLACLDHAVTTTQPERVVALTTGLAGLLRHDGPWAEALTRNVTALRAARHLGDRLGQANVLTNRGIMRRLTGDYPAATLDLEEALGISRGTSDHLDVANALTYLGTVRRLTGDLAGAVRDLEEGLSIYREIGNRSAEAEALNEAGTLYRTRGDLGRARLYHQQALDLAREIGVAWDEAHALAGLARCAVLDGRPLLRDQHLERQVEGGQWRGLHDRRARGRIAEDHQHGLAQPQSGSARLLALVDHREDLDALRGQDPRQPRDGGGHRSRAYLDGDLSLGPVGHRWFPL